MILCSFWLKMFVSRLWKEFLRNLEAAKKNIFGYQVELTPRSWSLVTTITFFLKTVRSYFMGISFEYWINCTPRNNFAWCRYRDENRNKYLFYAFFTLFINLSYSVLYSSLIQKVLLWYFSQNVICRSVETVLAVLKRVVSILVNFGISKT